MSVFVSIFQALDGNMRIDLGGAETGVAQQLLNCTEVGPSIEQMCRSTVSERVWTGNSSGRGLKE